MTGKEAVERVRAAAELLAGVPGLNISFGQVSPEWLEELATEAGTPVQRFLYARPEGPMVLARMEWRPVGVYVDAGTTYLPAGPEDDLSRAYDQARGEYVDLRPKADPATCSECSGPLEDGMGCTAREGRCGSCVYEGAMRAAKAKQAREDYEGRQRCIAEDLREDPYTAIGGAS